MSGFASTKDMAEKTVTFDELGPGLYAYTAEGDPNSGVIVGRDGVVVVDAQATPQMAHEVQGRIATVTDLPVRQVVLSHYHAVRVLGASGYPAHSIICSDVTWELIAERGQQDMDSEIGRFPRLFRGRDGIPGLT
jgi:glyoxylase-like metal-dependent hydrolase (beta-lactamase superfamily II)